MKSLKGSNKAHYMIGFFRLLAYQNMFALALKVNKPCKFEPRLIVERGENITYSRENFEIFGKSVCQCGTFLCVGVTWVSKIE